MSKYPSGLREQVATLLFGGSNPSLLSIYVESSLMVKLTVVVRVLSVRFCPFNPLII